MRVGIIGRRGAAFYAGLRALPDVQLEALCDLDQGWLEQEGREHAIPLLTTDWRALVEKVDAVVVATPMQLHAPMATACLAQDRHVMSEVTACVHWSETWDLLNAARASRATYFMAENYCYIRSNVLIRELVRQGRFGALTYAEGEYLHDVKPLHHHADGSPTWRAEWQVGINGNTYPTHSLGPVMQWFTDADPAERCASVVCLGSGVHTDPEHPHDDTTITLVKLASGKLVRLRLDMMSNRPHHMTYYSLQGTRGVYEASRNDHEDGHVWFGECPPPGAVREEHRSWSPLGLHEEALPPHWRNPPEAALRAGHGGGDYFIVKDWIDACRGEKPPAIPIETALEWTAVGLASQDSIRAGGAAVAVPNYRN